MEEKNLVSVMLLSGVIIFILLAVVGFLGEKTLFLFDNDRELAARVYKIFFVFFSFTAFALMTPALVSGFGDVANDRLTRIEAGEGHPVILKLINHIFTIKIGYILWAIFQIFAIIISFIVYFDLDK